MRSRVAAWMSAVLVSVAAGCGGAAGGGPTPEAAFAEFQAAMKSQNVEKVWGLLSPKSRDALMAFAKAESGWAAAGADSKDRAVRDAVVAAAERYGVSVSDLKAMDGRKYLSILLTAGREDRLGKEGEAYPVLVEGRLDRVEMHDTANVWGSGTVIRGNMKSAIIGFEREKVGDPWTIRLPDPPKRK